VSSSTQGTCKPQRIAEQCGGVVWGPVWPGPGIRVRNVCDPEGNIVHLRESAA
jgi:predicted enzyme related to lactoylglutathione lyase